MRTRIAFCITELNPGGAERTLFQLVSRLDRNIWEPHVYSLGPAGALVSDFEAVHIPVTCLNASSSRNLWVLNRLTRELKQFQPRILQTFLYHANIIGRIAAWRANVPVVVSGIRVAERRGRFRLWLDRITDQLVSRHVCVSQAVADFSIRQGGLPAAKVLAIPNGVDAPFFSRAESLDLTQFGIPTGCKTVLFVGRLDPQKGPFDLLAASPTVLEQHSNVHLLLVGDGPLKTSVKTWIQQHQLAERIHLSGWRDDVAGIYKSATCLVLPSHWEGMPNTVLEAMAAGLPVIATQVDGTADIIQHDVTGLLVPVNQPQELSSTINKLLNDQPLRHSIAKSAQLIVEKEFTYDVMIRRYEELYQQLLTELAS